MTVFLILCWINLLILHCTGLDGECTQIKVIRENLYDFSTIFVYDNVSFIDTRFNVGNDLIDGQPTYLSEPVQLTPELTAEYTISWLYSPNASQGISTWQINIMNDDRFTYRYGYLPGFYFEDDGINIKSRQEIAVEITEFESTDYPPLDIQTIWTLIEDRDGQTYIYNVTTSYTMALWFECSSIDTTEEKAFALSSYIIIGILLGVAILVTIIALIFHRKRKGSDTPGYISILRCFIEIIDLYTDISFTISVALNNDPAIWYMVSAIIISVSWLLSVIVSLWKINMYKRSKNSIIRNYMNSSDKPWLFMTLIFGFYATFDLVTSH